ncbi:MAG: hypothetical protein OXN89_13715 [Bryobacterales bacterium]|nr:hypothetical protein [Bryobacterales bacterium]
MPASLTACVECMGGAVPNFEEGRATGHYSELRLLQRHGRHCDSSDTPD